MISLTSRSSSKCKWVLGQVQVQAPRGVRGRRVAPRKVEEPTRPLGDPQIPHPGRAQPPKTHDHPDQGPAKQ